MATEVFRHTNPVFQSRTGNDPAPEIDVEIGHPFIPWRVRNVTYKRSFTGVLTTLRVFKKFGGEEAKILEIPVNGPDDSAFLDIDLELAHGNAVRVDTVGAAPGVNDRHSVEIVWEERLDQVG